MSPVELPIRYDESSMMAAVYAARAARLRELTPEALRVVELGGQRAPVALICFDYRVTDIGPYGEVGVAWPVVRAGSVAPPLLPLLLEQRWPGLGWWVHRLPVTTAIANQAGRELWGYPKIVADIDYRWDGARRLCTLREGDQDIFQLAIDTRMPARPMAAHLTTYSVLGSELLTTRIEVDAVGMRRRWRAGAELALGPHPIGRELDALGLDTSRAIEVRWFPVWRAVLPAACARERIDVGGAQRVAGAA